MNFTRVIKYGLSGEDVLFLKKKLFALGYFDKKYTGKTITSISSKRFGSDAVKATKAFQSCNSDRFGKALVVDGKIGELTWVAIQNASAPSVQTNVETKPISNVRIIIPAHINKTAANAIAADLANVSDTRKLLVLRALEFATDPYNSPSGYTSFYIRGGNLYTKLRVLNVMTKEKLASYFKKKDYAKYFNAGRQQAMESDAEKTNYTISGADCSGGLVGLWIHLGIVPPDWDANANTIYSKYSIKTSTPLPGDVAWKNGHIGLYVGGGYTVAWEGGAYGCQLAKLDRKVFNFVTRLIKPLSKWTAFGRVKLYD